MLEFKQKYSSVAQVYLQMLYWRTYDYKTWQLSTTYIAVMLWRQNISRQHAEWTSVLSFNVSAVIHQNCIYLLKGGKGWAATDNVHLRAARWVMPSRRGPHVMWQARPLPTYGANWASKLEPASKHPDKRSQWDAKLLVTSLDLHASCSLCTAAGPLVSGATLSHSVENGSISWRPGITCKWWEQTQPITFRNILYLEGSVERF